MHTAASSTPQTQTARALLALRELLLRGDFRPGTRLTELGLVSKLSVSRTPIRHALARLAHEGLLVALPAGGFRVRAFSLSEIWDAIEIRGVLEGTAARLAAERLTHPSELTALRASVAAIGEVMPQTLTAFMHYLDINEQFHAELRRLAKSAVLLRTMDAVLTLPFAGPSALVFGQIEPAHSTRVAIVALEHHRAIVEAIEQREGTRAESLAREHSRVSRMNLARALENQTLFRRMPGASLIRMPAATSGR